MSDKTIETILKKESMETAAVVTVEDFYDEEKEDEMLMEMRRTVENYNRDVFQPLLLKYNKRQRWNRRIQELQMILVRKEEGYHLYIMTSESMIIGEKVNDVADIDKAFLKVALDFMRYGMTVMLRGAKELPMEFI